MERTRIRLGVYVDLDPMPGAFHTVQSAKSHMLSVLGQAIGHYNPSVVIDSRDVSKAPHNPPAEGLLEGVLDELKEAKDAFQERLGRLDRVEVDDTLQAVLDLIDQIAEERLRYEREQVIAQDGTRS